MHQFKNSQQADIPIQIRDHSLHDDRIEIRIWLLHQLVCMDFLAENSRHKRIAVGIGMQMVANQFPANQAGGRCFFKTGLQVDNNACCAAAAALMT